MANNANIFALDTSKIIFQAKLVAHATQFKKPRSKCNALGSTVYVADI